MIWGAIIINGVDLVCKLKYLFNNYTYTLRQLFKL